MSQLKSSVHFEDVLNEVKHMLSTIVNERGVSIETDFSELNEIVSVRSFINSIFYNLISNSIKYSDPAVRPNIHISTQKLSGYLQLSFQDNGLGIDMTKHGQDVFGIYKRFHAGIEGRGLGLFMVKNQVESLKGSIVLESIPGKGSVFTISFP